MTALRTFQAEPRIELRDEGAREIDARLFEWSRPAYTGFGYEMVERGALDDVDASDVYLDLDHMDPLTGRATALEMRDDGPYGTFRVAKTSRGDELLELVRDQLYRNVSVAFVPDSSVSETRQVDGNKTTVWTKLDLRRVAVTWNPAHKGAVIVATRSENTEAEAGNMSTADQAPATAPNDPVLAAIAKLGERLEGLEERARKDVDIPAGDGAKPAKVHSGKWMSLALAALEGERVPEMELRALDDLITTDNLGAVPDSVRTELVGVIDPQRPFLRATRQVDAGDSGMKITFPRIVQKPIVGKQTAEKAEVDSRKTIIDTIDFGVITLAGAGDMSMQLLRRSSPAFLALWLELLAEAYAVQADAEAVAALIAAGVEDGGAFDVASPAFGGAFVNAMAVSKTLRPNRVFLSTAGLAAMIDAKEPTGGGGRPLYPGLASIASITDGANAGPLPVRMEPVHVPALDDVEDVDILVGPSNGFAWAEDGTYKLEADNVAKFGRDVGLGGMLWFMPIYPGAFTSYTLAEPPAEPGGGGGGGG